MPDLPPILIAALTGLFSGFFLSMPVGPVNLTILHEGSRRGFRYAFLVGLGACLMELIYCSIAFTGFASFFSKGLVKTSMEVFSFGFMIFLGVKFLAGSAIPPVEGVKSRWEERLNPHSAFMTGFVRTLGNPGLLLFWIIMSANFISRELVLPTFQSKSVCILCVALGTCLWFSGLSYVVSAGRRKMSEHTLLVMERGCGAALLVFGIYHGCRIVGEIIRAKHNGQSF